MKRLIYILILTFCFFGNQKSLAQTSTLKSSSASVTENGKWSDWTDFEKENPTPEIKRTTLKDWAWGNPNYFFKSIKIKI